ncbi:MAG TPA: hypothetical protein VK968_19095 [Roseimicrobium sp.]|nr:hypothetical protein [Roseimicrobium sp.]
MRFRRFNYLRDRLFLGACVLYVVNRFLIKPLFHTGFLHSHFNDLWLIPCALPPILWLHRRLGLRTEDEPPRISEIAFHLCFWSLLFEWIGPNMVPHATGDLMDVVAYAAGSLFAGVWWNWNPNWQRMPGGTQTVPAVADDQATCVPTAPAPLRSSR